MKKSTRIIVQALLLLGLCLTTTFLAPDIGFADGTVTVTWKGPWTDSSGELHINEATEPHPIAEGERPIALNIHIPPAAELVPRITFNNERVKTPDLWVAKTVAVAVEGWSAPDTDFRFTLRLDDTLAKEHTYRVFDASGNEVFNMVDPLTGEPVEEGGVQAPWKTDRNGEFTLKADQRAKFEWIGSGVSYEVTEWPTPSYTQLLPEGGAPAKGVVTEDGAIAAFGNLWVPTDEGEKTKLVITKATAYPTDLERPESPDFTFRVEVDGEPYAIEDYEITGEGVGITEGDNLGTTTAEGTLTLKSGQTATFSDVPVGVDWKVSEDTESLAEQGWRASGQSVFEGSTKAPLTLASFANATASFGVSKAMDDGSNPTVDFEFILTDANMKPWSDVKYYVHAADGTLTQETPKTTDSKGKFSLKAGQTAIFIGIDPNTKYSVREVAKDGYKTKTPVGGIYSDKTTSNAVEILPFVNMVDNEPGQLLVTKTISTTSGVLPTTTPDFTFTIKPSSGSIPAEGYVYSIERATGTETYRTDEAGTFTLKANETARFQGLDAGSYTVTEVTSSMPQGYSISSGYSSSYTKTLGTSALYFTFDNTFKPPTLRLRIQKTNALNGYVNIKSAEFRLEKLDAYGDVDTSFKARDLKSTTDTVFTVDGLEPGTYILTETKAPKGYVLADAPLKIIVSRTSDGGWRVQAGDYLAKVDETAPANYQSFTVDFPDMPTVNMPLTGSIGITDFLGWGTALVLLAIAYTLTRIDRSGSLA